LTGPYPTEVLIPWISHRCYLACKKITKKVKEKQLKDRTNQVRPATRAV
jgi:hypothetical protein